MTLLAAFTTKRPVTPSALIGSSCYKRRKFKLNSTLGAVLTPKFYENICLNVFSLTPQPNEARESHGLKYLVKNMTVRCPPIKKFQISTKSIKKEKGSQLKNVGTFFLDLYLLYH